MKKSAFPSGWVAFALTNLFIAAALGVLLRYKIAYPLPSIHQKHLLHAHSHFAFTGWVTQMLFTLLAGGLAATARGATGKRWNALLAMNGVAAFGMLASFIPQGYGAVSIAFSTLSILVSYAFAWMAWTSLRGWDPSSVSADYLRSAIIFLVLSSIGTFWLALLMARKGGEQESYLAALYLFLHFQYNGWFVFSILGLMHSMLEEKGVFLPRRFAVQKILTATLIPAYALSILWVPMPGVVYGAVVLTALVQLAAWLALCVGVFRSRRSLMRSFGRTVLLLGLASFSALTLKFVLQALSTIPSLGRFAFGIRPIVIAYLHLVMLLGVSMFLIAYAREKGWIPGSGTAQWGVGVFLTGVLLNETVLMLQGISFIGLHGFGVTNDLLLGISAVMMTGAFLIQLAAWGKIASERYTVGGHGIP